MRKKKQDLNGKHPEPLAIIDESDRIDYLRRQALMEQARLQFMAAGAFMDQLHQYMVEKYELPTKFELNLETGHVIPVIDIEEVKNVETSSV